MNDINFRVIDPALLLDAFDEPIVINRSFLSLTGGIAPALFLTYLVYVLTRDVPEDGDGWLCLTQSDWSQETGLSRYEQESARKILRDLRLIEERRVGMPARLEIRLLTQNLSEAMRRQAQSRYAGFVASHRETGEDAFFTGH